MCGFCGILRFEKTVEVDQSLINCMSATLTHRGPDDAGIYVGGQIGLGHRRLSIIDIAGGHQPMKSSNPGPLQVIVYDRVPKLKGGMRIWPSIIKEFTD